MELVTPYGVDGAQRGYAPVLESGWKRRLQPWISTGSSKLHRLKIPRQLAPSFVRTISAALYARFTVCCRSGASAVSAATSVASETTVRPFISGETVARECKDRRYIYTAAFLMAGSCDALQLSSVPLVGTHNATRDAMQDVAKKKFLLTCSEFGEYSTLTY